MSARGADRSTVAEQARAVIVLDGGCGLCSATVGWLARLDRRGRLLFCTRGSAEGQALLRRVAPELLAQDTVVLVEGERAHMRSDAAIRIARRLGIPRPVLAVLAMLPRSLRDALYDLVATNRYRFQHAAPACPVHAARATPQRGVERPEGGERGGTR